MTTSSFLSLPGISAIVFHCMRSSSMKRAWTSISISTGTERSSSRATRPKCSGSIESEGKPCGSPFFQVPPP